MFVAHRQKSKDELKASIRIGVKAREKRKKEKQNQIDASWILDIREWEYPETNNKKNNSNKGV